MKTEILCVTHAKDIDFCRAMVASYQKFATGFSRLNLVVPSDDWPQFNAAFPRLANIWYYPERKDKGMLHHEVQVCRADLWCPEADLILHLDADCVFKQPVTPEFYLRSGKPVLLGEPFADFKESYPTRYGWKKCVFEASGLSPEFETMVRHPHLHVRATYVKLRQLVEAKHDGHSFESYVLSCENTFPQTFAEFPTLGAVALEHFAELYAFELVRSSTPPDRGLVEFWSHGGLDYVSDRDHKYVVNGETRSSLGRTPRQVMEDLCLC